MCPILKYVMAKRKSVCYAGKLVYCSTPDPCLPTIKLRSSRTFTFMTRMH